MNVISAVEGLGILFLNLAVLGLAITAFTATIARIIR